MTSSSSRVWQCLRVYSHRAITRAGAGVGVISLERILLIYTCAIQTKPVADPGFPRGGGVNPKGGRQPIIWPIFPENCMKMKKFGAGGARGTRAPPLDPPLQAGVAAASLAGSLAAKKITNGSVIHSKWCRSRSRSRYRSVRIGLKIWLVSIFALWIALVQNGTQSYFFDFGFEIRRIHLISWIRQILHG